MEHIASDIALPVIERVLVDGIPVFVVDGPPPARCGLMFRVGRADETLPRAGISHLVEHLALFGIGDVHHTFNGFVDGLRTVFHAEGTEAECVEFLRAVTGSLGNLPSARVARERDILSAEAAGRGTGLFEELLVYRFGPRGLGMLAYPEFGLRWLDVDTVNWWRARAYHRDNAAAWVCGVDPSLLILDLPAGARPAPPAIAPVETGLPAWFTPQARGVGVSMLASRGPALSAALRIAQRRLQKRLRNEMAVVYHVDVAAQLLDGESVHVAVVCDPLGDNAHEARAAVEAELCVLAEAGPTEEDMDIDRRAGDRAALRPDTLALSLADTFGHDELLGVTDRSAEVALREAREVTAESVAAAIHAALGSALWAAPGSSPPRNARPVAAWSPAALDGRTLAPAPDLGIPGARLIMSDAGISTLTPQGNAVTVRYDGCAAVLAWGDGARTMYGDDGFILHVKPWEWADGKVASEVIDQHTDAHTLVVMGPGSGPPAPPETPRPAINPRTRRLVIGAVACLGFLFAALLLLTPPVISASDVPGVPAAMVPVNAEEDVECGGMTLAVAFGGGGSPADGEAGAAIDDTCRGTSQAITFGIGLLAAAPFVVMGVRRWWHRRAAR
jgi:hypothetical protein